MEFTDIATTGAWALWAAYGKDIKEGVLRKLGDKASKKTKELAEAAWDRVDWKISAGKYRQKLQELHGTIRILGKPEPVSLEGIFADVLILDTPSAFSRYDIQRLQAEPARLEQQPRRSGVSLVKDETKKRIFILGKPGAGKTTFLKYLTVQAAKGEIDRTPIFVSLKEWADSGMELMDFLVKQFDICDFPEAILFVEHILSKGHAIVLFDGLDEVNQEGNQRAIMINDLRDFSNKYFDTQCLITCRVAATEYTFERFVYVEIADFTDKQVKTFVKKWFKGSRKKLTLFNEAFNRTENIRLQELARTPLLLSLICLSFDATLDIPQRRAEIYEEAVEALLKKWDTSRSIKRDEIYRGLSLGRKRQMFARIAAQTFQDGEYFLQQEKLSKLIVNYLNQLPGAEKGEEIDGDAILKAIEAQHGIFTERAHRIYSFSHLTFQEYFTAKQIVADTTGRALRGLLAIENITDDRWREVITLTVSLLDNADDFFDIFITSLNELAFQEPLIVNILKWIKEKAEGFQESAPALRSYYCYLLLSLLLDPSFSDGPATDTASLSFARHYSLSHATSVCYALAVRLDRASSLSKDIVNDVSENIAIAYTSLHERDYSNVAPIPAAFIQVNSDIDLHLIHTFFFALTILNLKESGDTRILESKLRSYFIELRKYAISITTADGLLLIGKDMRIPVGADAARDLVVPAETAPISTWRTLVERVHNLVMSDAAYRIEFTDTQFQNLITFLLATSLVVDCLALAVVSNRTDIESRLLLPPIDKNTN
jgi:hypothetical protein